jgi:hypothetical protein
LQVERTCGKIPKKVVAAVLAAKPVMARSIGEGRRELL